MPADGQVRGAVKEIKRKVDFPLSLRDYSGLRGIPVESPFQLPDFRVEPANPGVLVGVGRSGDTRTMLLKALDAIGGLTHFVQPGDVVLIKPNVAFDRSVESAVRKADPLPMPRSERLLARFRGDVNFIFDPSN